jgi:hypothetical protein
MRNRALTIVAMGWLAASAAAQPASLQSDPSSSRVERVPAQTDSLQVLGGRGLPADWRLLLAFEAGRPALPSPRLQAARREGPAPRARDASMLAPTSTLPPGRVSDPHRDLLYSSIEGQTQVNASTAWCSPNVVTAFSNTEGAVDPTLSGVSFSSYSHSTDNGRTFAYGGVLTASGIFEPGSINPSVACTSPGTFFITQTTRTGILVFKSADGGETFSTAVTAVPRAAGHAVGDGWIAGDPSDRQGNTLYMTYTDASSSDAGCPGVSSTTIAITKSTDAGGTWSAPLAISPAACAPVVHSGSSVAVAGDGTVHAVFAVNDPGQARIGIARSTDGGASFLLSGTAAYTPAGDPALLDLFLLGANVRVLQGSQLASRPIVAVDRSRKPGLAHNVYVVFDVGSGSIPDDYPGVPSRYSFADVALIRSTDAGASFSAAARLNSNLEPVPRPSPFAGRGTDQYQPAVAVDGNGVIGACWYDRRNDAENFFYERYCARSMNGGAKWTAVNKSLRPSPPLTTEFHIQDDFDTVASDYMARLPGFRSAWTDTSRGTGDIVISSF